MKRMNSLLMRCVVGLIAIVCLLSALSGCGGKGDHHDCTFGANVEVTVGASAKCTETTRTCTECGKVEVVSTSKHSFTANDPQVVYVGEKAQGYKRTYTCKVCEYSYSNWLTDAEIMDAGLPSIEELNAEHIWTQTEVEVKKADYDAYLATKGETDNVPVDEGYIAEYYRITRSCSHCDEVETRVERRDIPDPNYKPGTGETPTDPSIPDPDEGDKECKHEYTSKITLPTCTDKGYTVYTCNKCDKSYTSDYTNATGHSWSNWTTKAATCTSNGTKTRTCANCNQVEKQTIPATGHTYGSWSTTKKATCETSGTKVRKCSCGATETQTIAATGHSFGSWSVTTKATCDKNGVETRKCSNCGKAETRSIPATGHAWDEGKVTTKPTSCSDVGVITYTCKNCGKTKVSQVKGEHSFGAWTWEEYTYKNEAGASRPSHRKVRSCTKCGYKEYGNTPDHYCAKGSANHTVSIIKEPTCSAKGVKRSTCKICGWYVDFEYGTAGAGHVIVKETVHLSDYTQYTNELDATISTCTECGLKTVSYQLGKGYSDYYRWKSPVTISQGDAYAGSLPVNDDMTWVNHPEWQMVTRDHVYDSEGYVKQFTVYWWYNGTRYSQVIKCDQASLDAWFAEYGIGGDVGNTFHLIVKGATVRPYRVTWRG